MATASIIVDGATDLPSADVTLADAASATFALRMAAALTDTQRRYCRALIQQKDSAGNYATIATLTGFDPAAPSVNISGPITVRVLRTANALAINYGVDQS